MNAHAGESDAGAMQPAVSLLVLRAADLAASRRFYEAIGLAFAEERHGRGPSHLAARVGSIVLELYPARPERAPERGAAGATMIGLRVPALEATLAKLSALGARVLTAPQASEWGLRAVVEDPDGRAIELSEPASAAAPRSAT